MKPPEPIGAACPPIDPASAIDIRRARAAAFVALLIAALSLGLLAMGRAGPPGRLDDVGVAGRHIGLRLNPNTATSAELQLLPRVGPVLAQRIIEHRNANAPFRTLGDLDTVRGIGPRTLSRLEPYLIFDADVIDSDLAP